MLNSLRRSRALAATLSAITAGILFVAVSTGVAQAYGTAGNNWTSLGCLFSGGAQAQTYWGQAKTYRFDSCGTYAVAYLDYKTGGVWYGPYYAYQWNDYTYAADMTAWVNASSVYTQHQIYAQGAWRQWESLMVW